MKNIDFDEDILMVQLLQLVAQHYSEYNKYVIDKLVKAQNINVSRLSP